MLGELRPQPFEFWQEVLPEIEGSRDTPGAYLLFSQPYAADLKRARSMGWPARELQAGHFHMVVDPDAVAESIEVLMEDLGINRAKGG